MFARSFNNTSPKEQAQTDRAFRPCKQLGKVKIAAVAVRLAQPINHDTIREEKEYQHSAKPRSPTERQVSNTTLSFTVIAPLRLTPCVFREPSVMSAMRKPWRWTGIPKSKSTTSVRCSLA